MISILQKGKLKYSLGKALTMKLETVVGLFSYQTVYLLIERLTFPFLSVKVFSTTLVSCLSSLLWLLLGLITVREMMEIDPTIEYFLVW